MKHLHKYTDFNFNNISNVHDRLTLASENGYIEKENIDTILSLFKKPEIGSFQDFISSDFFSHGDRHRMGNHLDTLDSMGIDTKACRDLKSKVDEANAIDDKIDEIVQILRNDSTNEVEEDYEKLVIKYNDLYPFYKKYDTEIIRLKNIVRNM